MSMLRSWSDGIATVVDAVRPSVLHLRTLARGRSAASGSALAGVQAGSPAATAGLRAGDLLLRLAERTVLSAGDLYRGLDRESIGREVELQVLRGSAVLDLQVVPREMVASGRGAE